MLLKAIEELRAMIPDFEQYQHQLVNDSLKLIEEALAPANEDVFQTPSSHWMDVPNRRNATVGIFYQIVDSVKEYILRSRPDLNQTILLIKEEWQLHLDTIENMEYLDLTLLPWLDRLNKTEAEIEETNENLKQVFKLNQKFTRPLTNSFIEFYEWKLNYSEEFCMHLYARIITLHSFLKYRLSLNNEIESRDLKIHFENFSNRMQMILKLVVNFFFYSNRLFLGSMFYWMKMSSMCSQLLVYPEKSVSDFNEDLDLLSGKLDAFSELQVSDEFSWLLVQQDLYDIDMTRLFPGCSFGSRLTAKQKASNRYLFEFVSDTQSYLVQSISISSLRPELILNSFHIQKSVDSLFDSWEEIVIFWIGYELAFKSVPDQ